MADQSQQPTRFQKFVGTIVIKAYQLKTKFQQSRRSAD